MQKLLFRGLGKRNSFGDEAVDLDLHPLLRDVPVAPLLPVPLWPQHLLCRSLARNREESRERRGASCEVSAVVKDPFPLCTHLKGVSSSADSLERLCQGPAEAQLLHAACSSGRMEKIQEGAHAGFIVAVPPLPFFDICPCQ